MYDIHQRLVTFQRYLLYLLLSVSSCFCVQMEYAIYNKCHFSFLLQLTFPHIACSRTALHLHQFKLVVECLQRIYCSVDTCVIFWIQL